MCPRDMAMLAEPVINYRVHNPLIVLASRRPVVDATTFRDCMSRKELSLNPFYVEVSIPVSAAQTLAAEIQGAAEGDEIIALGVGREKRGFNDKDRYWFNRMKWALDPILRYLRSWISRPFPGCPGRRFFRRFLRLRGRCPGSSRPRRLRPCGVRSLLLSGLRQQGGGGCR